MSDFWLGFLTAYLGAGALMFACAAREEGWPSHVGEWIEAIIVIVIWPESFLRRDTWQ